jgi:NADH-quinone oxidoreductase subunit E
MSDYHELIEPFKLVPGGVLEALHALQDACRVISPKALKEVAAAFKMTEAEVYGIATFYSLFSFYEQGRCVIRVCRSAPCHLQGAGVAVRALEKALNIPVGATTEDGKFTLAWTECVGQCQDAPVVIFDGSVCAPEVALRKIFDAREENHAE